MTPADENATGIKLSARQEPNRYNEGVCPKSTPVGAHGPRSPNRDTEGMTIPAQEPKRKVVRISERVEDRIHFGEVAHKHTQMPKDLLSDLSIGSPPNLVDSDAESDDTPDGRLKKAEEDRRRQSAHDRAVYRDRMREQTPGNDGRVRRHIVRIERARLTSMGIDPGGIEEERWKEQTKTQCATTSSASATSCVSEAFRSLRGCPPRTDETGAVETPLTRPGMHPWSAKAAKWLGEEKARLFNGLGCMDQITQQLDDHFKEQKKLAPLFPITTDDQDEYDHALLGDTWQDLDIEVTLDSGCVDHVLDASETPGYCVVESPGSMRKQKFIVGNGHKIPNKGQVHLNLEADGGSGASAIGAIFQVAAITRPLMSVSKICDQDLICTFTKEKASVTNKNGEIICEFVRRGGLYVANMRLKRPSSDPPGPSMPFARPDR